MVTLELSIQTAAVFIGDIKTPLTSVKFLASRLLFRISDKASLAIEHSRGSRLVPQGMNALTR